MLIISFPDVPIIISSPVESFIVNVPDKEFVTPLKSTVCPAVELNVKEPAPLNVTVPVVYASILVTVEEANVPVSVILTFSVPNPDISPDALYIPTKSDPKPEIDVTLEASILPVVAEFKLFKSVAVTDESLILTALSASPVIVPAVLAVYAAWTWTIVPVNKLILAAFTFTEVFPSRAVKSVAAAVPVTVNVNASFPVVFVNALFKLAAVSDVTVAVTTPLVLLKI